MRLRRKIVLGLIALAIIGAVVLSGRASRAKKDLERTRQSLRQQGFKIDLNEFDLSAPPEIRTRAALLATTTRAAMTNRMGRRFAGWQNASTLRANFTPVGNDAALVVWKQASVKTDRNEDAWSELRESISGANRSDLDAALQAAVGGPIRFEPIGPGPNALLPYLADLKGLEGAFRAHTLLALHEGQRDAAWTNLLAATCLVTEYTPEPIVGSSRVDLQACKLEYSIVSPK